MRRVIACFVGMMFLCAGSVHGIIAISSFSFPQGAGNSIGGQTCANKFIVGGSGTETQVTKARVRVQTKTSGEVHKAGIYAHDSINDKPDATAGTDGICNFDASVIPSNVTGPFGGEDFELDVIGSCNLVAGETYWFFLSQAGSSLNSTVYISDAGAGDAGDFVSNASPMWTGVVGAYFENNGSSGWFATPGSATDFYEIEAVPEPATYAMIFGVVAMGMVLLRRRVMR